MKKEEFSEHSPGRLEPTVFGQWTLRSGVRRVEDVAGHGFVPDPLPPKKFDVAEVLQALFQSVLDQDRVREKRASALLPRFVDELFLRPSLTIAEVRRLADINANTASAIVNRLCDKGILHEATGRKRDRIFVATQILEIIEEPGVG